MYIYKGNLNILLVSPTNDAWPFNKVHAQNTLCLQAAIMHVAKLYRAKITLCSEISYALATFLPELHVPELNYARITQFPRIACAKYHIACTRDYIVPELHYAQTSCTRLHCAGIALLELHCARRLHLPETALCPKFAYAQRLHHLLLLRLYCARELHVPEHFCTALLLI